MRKIWLILFALAAFSIFGCSRNTVAVDNSMKALEAAKESQQTSLKTLELLSNQTAKAASQGDIDESANEEIQKFVQTERERIIQQQQALDAAQKDAEAFKAGKSKKKESEVLGKINEAVTTSSESVRILDKKTEVIVDFLGNVTYSKSEIGALFRPGEFHLIPEQIKEGEKLFRPIVEKLYVFAEKYKSSFKSLHGEIIVTGYSDATPVEKGSKLYRELVKLINQNKSVEISGADLNRKLSELRATAVKDLLNQIISNRKNDNTDFLKINIKVLGKGEDLPKGMTGDIAKNDPHRRVVTFYWVVLPTL